MLIKPVLPVLDYALNYDYISKVLCVNKDKPKLKCNGKCHLMKELAKASDAENPIPNDKKNSSKTLEILFFQEMESFEFEPNNCFFKGNLNASFVNLYSFSNIKSIFHPPINIQ